MSKICAYELVICENEQYITEFNDRINELIDEDYQPLGDAKIAKSNYESTIIQAMVKFSYEGLDEKSN